ncbi:MAG: hypothetical protein KI790_15325 [Cyclobacteriaceae bacterium]|nr:hypothetical protein [Cyclobacteriaceae bacterium HetDA_MAG_MS6]
MRKFLIISSVALILNIAKSLPSSAQCGIEHIGIHLQKKVFTVEEDISGAVHLMGSEPLEVVSLGVTVLRDMDGRTIEDKLIKVVSGLSEFSIPTLHNPESGYYTILLYNPLSNNLLTTESFFLLNTENNFTSKTRQAINVAFYPEGGQGVVGLQNVIAFRITDREGKGIRVFTELFEDNTLLDSGLTHDFGVGKFQLVPKADARYTLNVYSESRTKLGTFDLPIFQNNGIVLRTNTFRNTLYVNLQSADDIIGHQLKIQSPGFQSKYTVNKKDLAVPLQILPEGPVQVSLFDPSQNEIGKRLVFVHKPNDIEAIVTHDDPLLTSNSANLQVNINNKKGNSLSSKASVSVIDDAYIPNVEFSKYSKLFSQLTIPVTHPSWFFEDAKAERLNALEDLFLVQSFRFPVGLYYSKRECLPKGIALSGKVKNIDGNVPAQKLMLTLPGTSTGIKTTTTDEEGYFSFVGLAPGQNSIAHLKVLNAPQSMQELNIDLYNGYEQLKPTQPSGFMSRDELEAISKAYKTQERIVKNYLSIEEAFPVTSEESVNYDRRTYRKTDYTINTDDYLYMSSMKETIKEIVPYVMVRKNRIRVFSESDSRTFPGPPLLLLDGIPVSNDSVILNLDPATVKSIEVINKLTTTAALGETGKNGMVAFYTKEGIDRLPKEAMKITIGGYLKPSEPSVLNIDPQVPDVREVLNWTPSAQSDLKGIIDLMIRSSNLPGPASVQVYLHNGSEYTLVQESVDVISRRLSERR